VAAEAAVGRRPGKMGWRQTQVGELLSEFLGTAILIAFGDGVVAMAVAALNRSGRGTEIFQASGDWLIIVFGWGFAVMFAVYVAGGISGAHINPAITLVLAIRRGFPWSKVPGYWAAQILGAFAGAALVWVVYHSAISDYETAHKITRGAANSVPTFSIFATFPAPYFHGWTGPFVDEVVGTAFLAAFVLALVDEWNQPPKANLAPMLVGFVVMAVGISYGANSGYAINPARDFGPRLFALIPGYGDIAIPGNYGNVNTYFWIPIVAPLVGAAIAGFIYDFCIRDVLMARAEAPTPGVEVQGRTVEDRTPAVDVEPRGQTVEERTPPRVPPAEEY
jgi:glycerol uptake facilitator protein